jgi:hypothetical protein
VVLHLSGVEHRIWLKAPPTAENNYLAERPFDAAFEVGTPSTAARASHDAHNGMN